MQAPDVRPPAGSHPEAKMTDLHGSDSGRDDCRVRVFISYRRQDTKHAAGRLRDVLAEEFGPDCVFVDVTAIAPGVNYVAAIDQAVSSCDVMLVMIGEAWLRAADNDHRRIDDPQDRLRLEVEAGLRHSTRVIPVLVDSAEMPTRIELPTSLAQLAQHHYARLRHESFREDTNRLLRAIDEGSPPPPPPTTQGSTARWVIVGLLVAAAVTLVLAAPEVVDTTLESRPNLPRTGPWATFVWLMPLPLIVVAAWLVVTGKRTGVALGCVAGGALWVLTSWVLAERVIEPELDRLVTLSHAVVLGLLIATSAGLVTAFSDIRERMGANTRNGALAGAVLMAIAIALRAVPQPLAQTIVTAGEIRWSAAYEAATFLLSIIIPLLVCLPAVLARCNGVQLETLTTVAFLQVLHPLVLGALRLDAILQTAKADVILVQNVLFLTGSVCMLLAVRASQSGARGGATTPRTRAPTL